VRISVLHSPFLGFQDRPRDSNADHRKVFESSVRYAVIGRDAPQLLSALNGLVPDLYLAADAAHAERVKRGEPDKCMEVTARLEALRLALEAGEDVHGLGHTHIPREGEEGTHTAIDYGHGHGHGHGHDHGEENVHKHLFPGPGHNHRQDDYHPHPHEAYLHPYEEKRADLDHLHTPDPHNDNRSHFASMLLIYHLVHSPLPTFYATYAPLVAPRPRRLVQRDYAAELASGEADSEEEGPPNLVAPAKIVPPPPAARVPFTTPAHLRFSRGAARAMAPESFDALLFGRMVADTVAHPKVPHDHPEALERALLAWASPRVRDEAALRLRRAYISAGAGWVAHALNLHGDAGVMLWALANGYVVRDGVVHLR
jgi:hypothetical protein